MKREITKPIPHLCRDCGRKWEQLSLHGVCPRCGSGNVDRIVPAGGER